MDIPIYRHRRPSIALSPALPLSGRDRELGAQAGRAAIPGIRHVRSAVHNGYFCCCGVRSQPSRIRSSSAFCGGFVALLRKGGSPCAGTRRCRGSGDLGDQGRQSVFRQALWPCRLKGAHVDIAGNQAVPTGSAFKLISGRVRGNRTERASGIRLAPHALNWHRRTSIPRPNFRSEP